ncbi:MAG: TIGR00282 family metallophosphoesterase [Fimbriimonadales bacterium]|nr:TIGR00282 family metallophosphoesterase [Fimbriimonadales bacterium]MDW8052312.1 TIGR00282 family metallophosphoesterase [Armatimonadota bacterium]
MRILFLADIVGRTGRQAVAKVLPEWRERYAPDIILANGENAAGGKGITPEVMHDLMELGIACFTTGNHIWDKKEIYPVLESDPRIVRPANYSPLAPGRGYTIVPVLDKQLAVISLAGRVFMEHADCPFRKFDEIYATLDTPFVFVDFHGEATSEKACFAYYVDGRASAVVGTHTHVQTADERILPKGTAFITDAGMCGALHSSIGMELEPSIQRFLTGMPTKSDVAKGPAVVCAVLIDLDRTTGKALGIQRLQKRLSE